VFVRSKKHGGFLLTEMLVVSAILGMLLVGLAVLLDGFARFNRRQLAKQRCTAAAQAQLDCLTVTGRPIPDEDFGRLWPGVGVSIKKFDGAGQWQGMKLVEVTTTGKSYRKKIKVRLSRYILGDPVLQCDAKNTRFAEERY